MLKMARQKIAIFKWLSLYTYYSMLNRATCPSMMKYGWTSTKNWVIKPYHEMYVVIPSDLDESDWIFYKKENDEMKNEILTVNKIETYNDRVVLIRWGDGTFTKAVCSPNDKFDIDVGIQVCYLKKLIGTENYYKFVRDSHKFLKLQEEEKAKAAEEKKARREKQKRIAEKKAKKRQAHIDAYKNDITEAVVAALDRHVGDDLK